MNIEEIKDLLLGFGKFYAKIFDTKNKTTFDTSIEAENIKEALEKVDEIWNSKKKNRQFVISSIKRVS